MYKECINKECISSTHSMQGRYTARCSQHSLGMHHRRTCPSWREEQVAAGGAAGVQSVGASENARERWQGRWNVLR